MVGIGLDPPPSKVHPPSFPPLSPENQEIRTEALALKPAPRSEETPQERVLERSQVGMRILRFGRS